MATTMGECQEPRCKHEASHVWGGRKVCQDHFEHYQEAEDKRFAEMKDDGGW
ncbi:MAG: hypothetical protein AABX37_01160 [Nanoarchaeota archaeon]